MWVAILFVLYTDGVPYVEADVAIDRAHCLEMVREFNQIVHEDAAIVVRSRASCVRV